LAEWEGNDRLSLFKDQSESAGINEVEGVNEGAGVNEVAGHVEQSEGVVKSGSVLLKKDVKFGDFIYQKWKSVSRY
jgi:hypothetical protein